MLTADTMYFAAWIATMIIYVWGAIYAVGRLEGELNGLGKRIDMAISQLQTLERRFAELERYVREKKRKEAEGNGGDKDSGSEKSYVY